jgi:hypothetical protein
MIMVDRVQRFGHTDRAALIFAGVQVKLRSKRAKLLLATPSRWRCPARNVAAGRQIDSHCVDLAGVMNRLLSDDSR